MAIIIDANCYSRVFCRKNKEHYAFQPVLNWIINGNGFLVYGGSKYKRELLKSSSYLKFFRLLNDYRKVITFPDDLIDDYQRHYQSIIRDADFDDPHLPAIVLASKCRLICTCDTRSKRFVTSPELYPKNFHTPYYYTGIRDEYLLCDENIDKRLSKHKHLLNKKEKEVITRFLSKQIK